jgi:hypothetical protein
VNSLTCSMLPAREEQQKDSPAPAVVVPAKQSAPAAASAPQVTISTLTEFQARPEIFAEALSSSLFNLTEHFLNCIAPQAAAPAAPAAPSGSTSSSGSTNAPPSHPPIPLLTSKPLPKPSNANPPIGLTPAKPGHHAAAPVAAHAPSRPTPVAPTPAPKPLSAKEKAEKEAARIKAAKNAEVRSPRRARWATLGARWVTLRARWVTLRARWVTLRACWATLIARWVTLRARWVTLRARWVTLRARWVTLRASPGDAESRTSFVPQKKRAKKLRRRERDRDEDYDEEYFEPELDDGEEHEHTSTHDNGHHTVSFPYRLETRLALNDIVGDTLSEAQAGETVRFDEGAQWVSRLLCRVSY